MPVSWFNKEKEREPFGNLAPLSSVGCTNQEFSLSCRFPVLSKLFRSRQLFSVVKQNNSFFFSFSFFFATELDGMLDQRRDGQAFLSV